MKTNTYIKRVIVALLLLLIGVGAASAEKGSIIVTDIDIDGYSTTSASVFNQNIIYVGDTGANLVSYGQIKFNLTNQSGNISGVVNNITSVRVWLYPFSNIGNPNFAIISNYSYNTTWGSSQKGTLNGSYNKTDLVVTQTINKTDPIYFEISEAYISNRSSNILTVQIEPSVISTNAVADNYGFNSSRATGNIPYLELLWDNTSYNNTHYRNISETYGTINDFTSQGYWLPLVVGTTDGSVFIFLDTKSSAITAKYNNTLDQVDYVNLTSKPLSSFNSTNHAGTTSVSTLVSESTTYSRSDNSWFNSKQSLNKRYYRNVSNATIFFNANGSISNFYNNGSAFSVGGDNYAMGGENFYNISNGYVLYSGNYYQIDKTYLAEEEDLYYNVSDLVDTYTRATWENFLVFDGNSAQGAFWSWQVGNIILRRGSVRLKNTNEFFTFNDDEMAMQLVTKNRTAYSNGQHVKIMVVNSTFYANSSNGTLILNLSLFAELKPSNPQHMIKTVTGTWTYPNGSVVNITTGYATTESIIRKTWDSIDFVNNAYLVDERLEGQIESSNISASNMFNFTVRGNNANNISAGIYNTTKLYNSTQVKINNSLDGLFNNLSLPGNGTYVIKSLNVTLNSSAVINVTVNTYNSSVINFTADNTTAEQTMNLTVYNDTYPIVNGVNYQILKDGMNQQISTASDNSVAFSSISVGSDYTIQQVISPASITSITASATSSSINWTWTNPNDSDFNHTEIYLDGVFTTNTSLNYYLYTLRSASTSYTLSTRTSDTNYNVNSTWVNMTNTTSISPSSLPSSSGGSGSYLETIEVPPKNTPTFNITYNNNTIPLIGSIKIPKNISDYKDSIDKRLLFGVAFIALLTSLFIYSNLSNKKPNKHKRRYT